MTESRSLNETLQSGIRRSIGFFTDLETELLSQFYKRVKKGLKEKNQCRKIKT